jgi:hypothetical protein
MPVEGTSEANFVEGMHAMPFVAWFPNQTDMKTNWLHPKLMVTIRMIGNNRSLSALSQTSQMSQNEHCPETIKTLARIAVGWIRCSGQGVVLTPSASCLCLLSSGRSLPGWKGFPMVGIPDDVDWFLHPGLPGVFVTPSNYRLQDTCPRV